MPLQFLQRLSAYPAKEWSLYAHIGTMAHLITQSQAALKFRKLKQDLTTATLFSTYSDLILPSMQVSIGTHLANTNTHTMSQKIASRESKFHSKHKKKGASEGSALCRSQLPPLPTPGAAVGPVGHIA